MGRAPCCEKVGLMKGRWTAQEDEILTNYIQVNGEGSWRSLPKNAGLLRCGKSCRLRWINYLRADLKRGNISAQEEEIIINLHASLGNRWSLIASHLPGRTDNELKNYWNSHLRRKIYAFRRPSSTDQTQDTHTPKANDGKRKGGRTSRWAMKKNKSNFQEARETPKESVSVSSDNQNSTEVVTLPPTPALENESLCLSAIELEDLMALEGSEVDKEPESIKGCKEGIDGDGVLCFNDVGEPGMQEEVELGGGVVKLSEERERNDGDGVYEEGVRCPSNHGMGTRDAGSMFEENKNWEWDWDWDCDVGVMQMDQSHGEPEDQSRTDEDTEKLLSSLWQDDDWESGSHMAGEIDPQTHDAMLDWFLS